MKKYFPYIFIAIITIGIFFPVKKTLAAAQCYQSNGYPIPLAVISGPGTCNPPNIWSNTPPTSQFQALGATAPQQQATPDEPQKKADSCNLWDGLTFSGCMNLMLNPLFTAIFMAIINLCSWIVGFAGKLLNYVIGYTILDMSAVINGGVGYTGSTYGGLSGINISWKIIRDLMNIAFIFTLVYEGILLILDIGSLQSIRKFLFGVVMASLLINFSLFFTKVLIDASNIATLGLYSTSVGTPPAGKTFFDYGLSDSIMSGLGLTSIWGGAAVNPNLGNELGQILISGLGISIVMLVSAFVFFAVSIMMLTRYITLIFLLMLSPIAYMGMALPFMKSYSKEWWDSLKGQLLFPPIYMAMTLIVLKLIEGSMFLKGQAYFSDITQNGSGAAPSTSYIGLMLNFAVVLGLVIASLITSKKWASMGSKHIGTMTKSLTGFAGGVVAGGAGAIGRRTIGARANRMAEDQGLKDRAAGIGVNAAQQRLAQIQLASYRKAASGSFDVRRSKIGEMTSEATGVSLGKGTAGIPFLGNAKAGEGGYKKANEEKAKKEKEYIESLKTDDDAEKAHKEKAKKEAETILNAKENFKKYKDMSEEELAEHLRESPENLQKYNEAKAAADKMEEIEKRDEEAREKFYSENPEKKAELEKAITDAQAAAEKAKTEEAELKTSIETREAESAARIEKLTTELKEAERAAKFGLGTPAEKAAVDNAQKALSEEKERAASAEKEIEQDKKTLQTKVAARKKAEEDVTAATQNQSEARMKILSDEHQNLVADLKGQGKTLYQKRGEAYATSIETAVVSRLWNGKQTNKARASAVRKAVKEKKSSQKLEDMMKEYAKEYAKENGEPDKKDSTATAATPEPKAPESTT